MTHPRIACIGAGAWGINLVRNFHEIGALHRVVELDAKRRTEIGAKYPSVPFLDNVDAVLNDPDIAGVAIATPAVTHGDLAARALRAGKDVFVEKPLCLSPDQGKQLVELAAANKRILMVGHLLWYHPAVLALKDLIDKGELGKIQYIYSHRLNLGKIRREENILWSFAPHDLSVILGLIPETPDEVQAQGGYYLHPDIADVTTSLISFPSGVKAHIFVSWLHPFKEQKLVVVGDRQMAVFDDVEEKEKLRLYPHSIEWKNQLPVANKAESKSVPLPAGEPLRAECLHFLECVQTRKKPRTDGEEGLRVLSLLQKCEDALQRKAAAPAARPADRRYKAHASAFVDDGVEIGEGTSIWHVSHILKGSKIGRDCKIGQNVVVGPNAIVGNGVKIQNNVSVYEGVTLEDHVFCGPSMVFTNVYNPRSEIVRKDEYRPTLVKKGATLGANCTIVCGITLGQYSFIGAGAVVLETVPDHALVVGNPGRIIGWMCSCGNRIEFSGDSGRCNTCNRPYARKNNTVAPA